MLLIASHIQIRKLLIHQLILPCYQFRFIYDQFTKLRLVFDCHWPSFLGFITLIRFNYHYYNKLSNLVIQKFLCRFKALSHQLLELLQVQLSDLTLRKKNFSWPFVSSHLVDRQVISLKFKCRNREFPLVKRKTRFKEVAVKYRLSKNTSLIN